MSTACSFHFGIAIGFAAAFSQSLSYLFSRWFTRRCHESTLVLLIVSHMTMGIFSIVLIPFLWPAVMPPFREYAPSLLGCAGFYLMGQTGLFFALKKSDASRISPLLGLKILILAVISILFFGQHYSWIQWLAVVLSLGAAILLNWVGGTLPLTGALWILFTCVGYSLSDLYIKELVGHFQHLGLLHASFLCACLCYILCGVASLTIGFFNPWPTRKMWAYGTPFAVAWFIGMLCIYACFASIGVVFGNIVQSSRGIISIVLGSLVAAAGHEHLERRTSRRVLIQRIVAAILMMAAIALFNLAGC
jgi:drug/metabolite transporter (DMT)-like permease